MDTKELEKFDPTIADLQAIVATTKDITADNLEDKKQIAIVKENRIALKNARVKIQKTGKELRADAIKFQNDVIAKERELIAIIEPEEKRLAEIEEEAKALAVRKTRMAHLPAYKLQLERNGLSDFNNSTDEELLELDSAGIATHYNNCLIAKTNYEAEQAEKKRAAEEKERREAQEAEDKKRREAQEAEDVKRAAEAAKIKAEQDAKAAELAAKEKALEDERLKIKHEKDIADAAEAARLKSIEDAAREAKEKEEAEERKAKEIAEQKKRDEAELQKKKRYQDFLKSHGWTQENSGDFKLEKIDGTVFLYKLMGTFVE